MKENKNLKSPATKLNNKLRNTLRTNRYNEQSVRKVIPYVRLLICQYFMVCSKELQVSMRDMLSQRNPFWISLQREKEGQNLYTEATKKKLNYIITGKNILPVVPNDSSLETECLNSYIEK